jgi:hypothetical protein
MDKAKTEVAFTIQENINQKGILVEGFSFI